MHLGPYVTMTETATETSYDEWQQTDEDSARPPSPTKKEAPGDGSYHSYAIATTAVAAVAAAVYIVLGSRRSST